MQTSQKERIRKFIEHTGLNRTKFATKMESTRQELGNWLAGKPISTLKTKAMLKAFPELNGHWLLTGEGNMLLEATENCKAEICTEPFCLIEKAKLKDEVNDLLKEVMEYQRKELEWRKKGWIKD